jgi:hypothetical protein
VAVGLVWLLGHLAFWLGGMRARRMSVHAPLSYEQLPLKSASLAIASDNSEDSLIPAEVEMAAALHKDSRSGDSSISCSPQNKFVNWNVGRR